MPCIRDGMTISSCAICNDNANIHYITKSDTTTTANNVSISNDATVAAIQGSSALSLLIVTQIAKFCPSCGRRLKGE